MRGIEQYLQVDAATLGALKYAGTWNASTNTPTLASGVGVQGQYYVVSVAGSTNLDGETAWQVGDWAVFNGSVWQKVDGGSTGLLTTLTVTGNTFLATTSGSTVVGGTTATRKFEVLGTGAIPVRVASPDSNMAIEYYSNLGTRFNWLAGAQYNVSGGFEITPSTVAGGTTYSTPALTILSGGNVGIGTSSFAYSAAGRGLLEVNGSSSALVGLKVGNVAGGYLFDNGSVVSIGAPAGRSIVFDINGEKMRLDASGNVGIGTSSPSNFAGYTGITCSDTSGGFIELKSTTGSITTYIDSDNGISRGTVGTRTNHPLAFTINNTERMRIDASGNVGIGVTPSERLDVQTTAGRFQVQAFGAGSVMLNSNGALAYKAATVGHQFFNGATQAMTLDASGNLGLGVTPSAWDRPAYQSTQNLAILGLANTSNFVQNAYYNAGWKYMTSASAADFQVAQGAFYWFTAPSGTAGNAISFTQAMTLDASGNLALGSTSTSNARIFSYINDASLPSIVARQDGAAPIQTWQGASGSERARITSGGDVGIGTSSPLAKLHVEGADGTTARIKSNTGTTGNYAQLLLDSYNSFNGTGQAYIRGVSSASGNSNTDLTFGVNASGFGSPYEAMRITSAGNIVAGASAALATTATDGFLYVPTCAGTPTGTPTAITGMVPIVVDTTNNKLYFYSSAAWRDAGP